MCRMSEGNVLHPIQRESQTSPVLCSPSEGIKSVEKAHLEYGEKGLPERVEILSGFVLTAVKIKFSSENLHPEQGKDDDEEEEKEQEGGNGLNRIK